MTRSRTFIATPPGVTIKEQLLDRGMSQKEFSVRMDMSEKHISRLINGDVQLTPDVALRLEIVFGIEAGFWNRLESIYREKLARVESENNLDNDKEIASKLPYNEMVRLEWIPATRNEKDRIALLRKYFEIVTLCSLGNTLLSKSTCNDIDKSSKKDLAVLAWIQKAHICARNIDTDSININKLKNSIQIIRNMTTQNPSQFYENLKNILASCGIALVFLPKLKDSSIQKISFIDGNKIVLCLTSTTKESNIFWFDLFHELGHIVLGHLTCNDNNTLFNKNQANEWANNILIPVKEYQVFIEQNDFSDTNIRLFADRIGLAPGIIVGRLQSDKIIKSDSLNQLKDHYELAI